VREGNRATRSAALVAGFWLAAWLQVVAALAVVLLILALLTPAAAVRIGAPLCIATAGLLWFATSRALRVRHATPAGVPVTRADAPALWSLIDAAAATAQAAPPDGVTVIADARVWVGERFRLIGLRGGPRQLYLGLPLLQAWDTARLGAAVTHELAHSSTVLGRFAPSAYRGRLAVARIVRRIPRRSPAGPLLRAYASFYRRLDSPFAWAQELAADRAAAAFAGPRPALAVLRDAPALEEMQHLFHAEYLSAGWQAGFVPDDVFGGLLRVLAARPDEMARLRALAPDPVPDGDTHPPLADRATALSALIPPGAQLSSDAQLSSGAQLSSDAQLVSGVQLSSDAQLVSGVQLSSDAQLSSGAQLSPDAQPSSDTPVSPDPPVSPGPRPSSAGVPALHAVAAPDEPAAVLVPDLPGLGRALQAVAFPATGRTVVDWDEFFSVTRNAEMEREADAALHAIGHAIGTPMPGLAEVLDLVADGRLPKAAEVVFAGLPPAEATDRITDLITLLLALAALRSGAARWRHSWSGTAELVAIDGAYLDLAEPARLAADPATVDAARARLATLGIDLAVAAAPDPARPPARVPVHGGVVNVLADGVRTDLLVLETGLLLLPALPRSRNGDARRRLARLAAAGINPDGTLAAKPRASDTHPPTPAETALTEATASYPTVVVRATGGHQADPAAARLLSYSDVTRAAVMQGRRRQWELTLAGGTVLNLRTTLDSDELQGGWAALDEAVAFLTRTRTPAGRDLPPTPESPDSPREQPGVSTSGRSPSPTPEPFAPPSRPDAPLLPASVPVQANSQPAALADLAAIPTSGGPVPSP
jgi:hypothetical protein